MPHRSSRAGSGTERTAYRRVGAASVGGKVLVVPLGQTGLTTTNDEKRQLQVCRHRVGWGGCQRQHGLYK